eukprot:TRINITY_DN19090_c0_g1_i4.p2 TRINITY_DN19090_c0_g1~~TRINITY_DN19090_c0_g1_i4.p2  ORF type:complete len:111 (+),score=15.75 TRINITY_DN19090_c0_g1_i4:188-520(+)
MLLTLTLLRGSEKLIRLRWWNLRNRGEMSPSAGARRNVGVETLRVETRRSDKNCKRLQTREIDSRWWYSVGLTRSNIAFHNSSGKSSQDCDISEEDKSMITKKEEENRDF